MRHDIVECNITMSVGFRRVHCSDERTIVERRGGRRVRGRGANTLKQIQRSTTDK